MVEDMGKPESITHSLDHEEISTSTVELNKKRKLQFALGLPLPKHKFRDRCGTSFVKDLADDGDSNNKSLGNETSGKNIADELEQYEESEKDSNSFTDDSCMEMALDKNNLKPSSTDTFHLDQQDTASNSSTSKASKEYLYSLDGRSATKERKGPYLHGVVELEDIENQDLMYGNNISACEKDGIQLSEAATDMLLYSNDAVLSSGGWDFAQDARLGARKPTIDQEFEQYFSMLML